MTHVGGGGDAAAAGDQRRRKETQTPVSETSDEVSGAQTSTVSAEINC